jgi:hypothetical protein
MTAIFFQPSNIAGSDTDGSDSTGTVIKNQPIGLRTYLHGDTSTPFNPDLSLKDQFKFQDDTTNNKSIKKRLEQRRHTATRAKIASHRLNEIKRIHFKTLRRDCAERLALEYELETIFNIIYADLRLNGFNSEGGAKLKLCAKLLETLIKHPPFDEPETPENDLEIRVQASDKPAKYVALQLIAPWVAEAMLSMDSSVMNALSQTEALTHKINSHRLNWVWSGGLDMAILSLNLLPNGVGHTQYTQNTLTQFSIGTSYMSFVLYYFRLGLNLSLLVHGTLKGSWMNPWQTQADKEFYISLEERFRSQWQQRKFIIINDAFWATANLACFMYLIGNGLLGYIGVLATAGLLLMDVGLTIWGYGELKADHDKLVLEYKKEQDVLISNISDQTTQLKTLNDNHSNDNSAIKQLNKDLEVLRIQLEQSKKNMIQCEFDWDYTNQDLYNNLVYACVLSLAFGLICCSVLYPPLGITAANALILGLVGSAISCISTIGIHAKTATKEIEKSRALIEKATDDDKTYQEAMLVHNQWVLGQKIVSDVLLPAAVFALLVFAPTGLSLPILIPIVVVLLLSGSMLEACKPQPACLPEMMLDETLEPFQH